MCGNRTYPTDYFISFNPRATERGSDLPEAKARSAGGQLAAAWTPDSLQVLPPCAAPGSHLQDPSFIASTSQLTPTLQDKLRRWDSRAGEGYEKLPSRPRVPQIHDKKGCPDRLGAYQLADIPSLCCPLYCMVKTLSIC